MNVRTPLALLFCVGAVSACGDGNNATVNNGATNNGATNNGATNNGATNNGATNNGATNNGATNNGATNNGATNNGATNNGASCVPDRDAFVANALPHIENFCGNCHSDPPAFGAPAALLDYDKLVAGPEGERLVDRMTARLVAGEMPPAGSPRPTHQALDTLVEWTSCGNEHANHTDGLEANRALWQAPEEAPAGLETFDVTANEFAVGPTTLDLYQCFVVPAPISEPRLMRRIEPLIDDGRVLHHSLVKVDSNRTDDGASFECGGFPPGENYVYVWGPGQSPIEFPDGGIRIEPGDRFVLQIHYNNGAGAQNVLDSSGFRVFHEPVGGTDYSLFEVGPLFFSPIPAGATRSAFSTCTVTQDTELIASWPHMHEIGSEFKQTLTRADGSKESIIELTGWQFEAQLIYDTPFSLKQGDVLTTECTWVNYKTQTVVPGLGTADEMCFNFMYVAHPGGAFCQ